MSTFLRPLLFVSLLIPNFLFAQSNYSQTNFRFGTTTYKDISSDGTIIPMTDLQSGTSAAPQNIGFSFNFNGIAFTQFMIHADGILCFGTSAPGAATDISASNANSYSTVFTSTAPAFQNIVLPLFTNLVAGSSTPIFHVQTTGAAPNRICTVQWKNLRDADNPAGGQQHQYANIEFQVKLYETTNDIAFIYGNWIPSASNITAARRNAACGIKASNLSFHAYYRPQSFTSFYKAELLDQPRHVFLERNAHPINKSNTPVNGFTIRHFGRISNDVSLAKLYIDSITPAGTTSPGNMEVLVRNEGANMVNNINVRLHVSGANTHDAVVNIASLAAGAERYVTFPAFAMPNKGTQTITASVTADNDDRIENNQLTATQIVSNSHTQVYDYAKITQSGVGYNGSPGLIALKIFGSGTRKISQIRIPFITYRNAVNVRIYEDGGNNGSPSASPIFNSPTFFTTDEQEMIIPIIPAVTVSGDYFIVVNQQTAFNMGWTIGINTPHRFNRTYDNTNGLWIISNNSQPWQVLAQVYEESNLPDIGIERLVTPGCTYATDTEVKISLRNFSNQPIDFEATPTTITGKVKNPAGVEFPFTIQKSSGTLNAGAAEEITVLTNYNYAVRGSHFFSARTNLAGDVEPGNDSLLFFINNSIPVTRSLPNPVCPLTTVTLTGPTHLGGFAWNVEGVNLFGPNHTITPIKTTIVRTSGTDYRGCLLQDSIIIEVENDGLPPRPILIYGDTILSHRNGFRDTVRVKKLAGHTIRFIGASGIVAGDSAYVLPDVAGMNEAKVAAAYVRASDGCANLSDTLTYSYAAGVLHNNSEQLTVCDTAFYDSGGPLGNTGLRFTRTFMPATPGTKMRVTFYRLALAQNASIQIFDGPTFGNMIVNLSPQQNGNMVREFISSHPTGALTIRFNPGFFTSEGWWAGLTCHMPGVYRTVESGNWITPAIWERKVPNGIFMPALRPPVKGDDTVYIRHNVILTTSTPMDQVVVEEGATLNFESVTSDFISMVANKTVDQPEFLIKGTLNIGPSAGIFGFAGQMHVTGRLNNFGEIGLDTIVFNGNTPQMLGNFSGASGTMKILRLDNPTGLTMGSDQTIEGIHFVQGMLRTDTENLLTLTGDNITGARDEAHVNGPIAVRLSDALGTRLYPIGSRGRYRPVLLETNSANFEGGDESIMVSLIEGMPPARTLPPSISKVSELRYYRITRTGTPNAINFIITLPYNEDDGVTDPNHLTIAKSNGANDWEDIGGTPSGSITGTIRSHQFDNLGDFTLANKAEGGNPLPVIWMIFEAAKVNADAHLYWRIAQEQRCSLYEVERSTDGVNYLKIGQQICRNSQVAQNYNYVDVNPGKGTFYYRLRQVDTDGKYQFSPVRKVSFGLEGKITVYPNPARDRIIIAEIPGNSDIRLFDASGRMVIQSRNAQAFAQLQVSNLPAGIYQLSITTITGERFVEKVQIMR